MMGEDHLSTSELVSGLVLTNRVSKESVRPEIFCSPYDNLIRLWKAGDYTDYSDLIGSIGLMPIQSAVQAASSVNQDSRVDWVQVLEKASIRSDLAFQFDKHAKKLRRGEDIDAPNLISQLNKLSKVESKVQTLYSIKEETVAFLPTGWRAFDENLVGLPKVGLVVIGAPPKTGKTTSLIKISVSFIRKYPDKKALLFSFEMPAGEYKKRIHDLNLVHPLTEEEENRILICEEIMSVDAMANVTAGFAKDNIGLVGIDFVDFLVQDVMDEQKMTHCYLTCATLAKQLSIPVILLSQLNGYYQGGLPRPIHLRFTRMAEALSWMVLMLYNPAQDYFEKKDAGLPITIGKAYIIAWLIRGGFPNHLEDSPGAIQISWSGKTGWMDRGSWRTLQKGE
jgi:Replicative DNA helicase